MLRRDSRWVDLVELTTACVEKDIAGDALAIDNEVGIVGDFAQGDEAIRR